MINNKKKFKFNYLLIYMLTILCLFSFLFAIPNIHVYAEETTYSNVLDDLQKDKDFNIANYPAKISDYSLSIISVAEGENNELFIYVYQPSGTLRASHISMATGTDGAFKPVLYNLIYINFHETLFKYKVEGFLIKPDLKRYYNIPEIFRPFDKELGDEELTNGNIIDEVPFKVAKSWTVSTVDGELIYQGTFTEVIEITDMYVGFVRYPDGWLDFWPTSCDAHYVAFDTDKPINKLLEATITYSTQSYKKHVFTGGNDRYSYGEIVNKPNYEVMASDEGVFDQGGIFGVKKDWKRIETVEDFIKRNNEEHNEMFNCGVFNVETWSKLTEEGLRDLKGKKWVLNFAETDYSKTKHNTYSTINGTMVGNVAVLRLEFETAGKVYNLGVVGNMQTGDGKPDNETGTKISLPWWVWLILALICVCLLGGLFPVIFTFLWFIIKSIFKGVWWLITAPFSIFDDD